MQVIYENPVILLIALFILLVIRANRPVNNNNQDRDGGSGTIFLVLIVIGLIGALTVFGNHTKISDLFAPQEATLPGYATDQTTKDTVQGEALKMAAAADKATADKHAAAEANKSTDASIWEYDDEPDTPPHGHPTDAKNPKTGPYTEFMLRVGFYTVKDYAEDHLKALEQQYINATIVTTADGKHHVGLGPFTSEAEAKAAQRRLSLETYLVSFDYP